MALYYIGGILKHAKALCGDLQSDDQHLQAPGARLRSAGEPGLLGAQPLARPFAFRLSAKVPKAKRIEYRPPDPAANPYLCYTALLMAGLDGVLNKIDPGEPMDKNHLRIAAGRTREDSADARQPGRGAGLSGRRSRFPAEGRCLHARTSWRCGSSHKRKEHDALRLRPHPYEFFLYYDV